MAKILIVEDERIVARDLGASLSRMGYDVVGSASSSDEAIDCATRDLPDLVLMDIRIQGKLDGIATAEILRRHFDVPVIYLTAYADDATVERAKHTTPLGYIVKPFKSGELKGSIEVALARHQLDRSVRESERWYSTTLRSVGDAVVAVDPAGLVRFMNPVAEGVLGSRLGDSLGRGIEDVVGVVDERSMLRIDHPVRLALEYGCVTALGENAAIVRAGVARPIEDSASPIVDESGHILGAVMVFRDVSEKRKLKEQLALSERLTSLGTLTAGVAHEINNPLSVVLASAEMAGEDLTTFKTELEAAHLEFAGSDRIDKILRGLSGVTRAAEMMCGIVANLRDFSSPQREVLRRVNVEEIVERALGLTAALLRARARVVRDFHPTPEVEIGERRLVQVLVNLLSNAAHAVSGRVGVDHEIRVSTGSTSDGRVVIRVSDTGIGMSPETRKRVFDPFFTTRAAGDGNGLGLWISQGIVRSFGGEIEVASELGNGSQFSILLNAAPEETARPTTDTAESGAGPVTPPAKPSARRGRVCVIDDEKLVTDAISAILGRDNEVVVFNSPESALSLLRQRRDFDVILCDLSMPGISGPVLYERVCREAPELEDRFVFVTGGARDDMLLAFFERYRDRCIDKPFHADKLRSIVADFVARR